VSKRTAQIKGILERLYEKYNRRELISPDPLQFVYRYSNQADMEIAAFLASALAYGRVQQIEKSLTNLLGRVGESPSEFVINFNKDKRQTLKDFKHRFTTGDDISDLLTLLRTIIYSCTIQILQFPFGHTCRRTQEAGCPRAEVFVGKSRRGQCVQTAQSFFAMDGTRRRCGCRAVEVDR